MAAHKNLQKIDHVIVLMLENRSFDEMLGWLYDAENAPPFDRAARGQPYDGLSGRGLTNPIPAGVPGAQRGVVPAGKASRLDRPNPDPGEEYQRVNVQIYGTAEVGSRPSTPGAMMGFVEDYIAQLREKGVPLTYESYAQIMDGYAPAQIPTLAGLAHAYAVCDQWHSSVPTMTMPNRSFFHAATSGGRVLNTPYVSWVRNDGNTVFNLLEAAHQPWKVYFDADTVAPLTMIIHLPRLIEYALTHFHHMDTFFQDCKAGTLPTYSFIEPRFFVDPNDQHPPHGVAAGDELIRSVYESVRWSPAWEKTLLCITYDEHGGCYDHVLPPQAVAPGDGAHCPQGFGFDRLGVRVPMVLVSPWIEAGTVFRGSRPFDHTSMIKTICERWGLPSLTQRDAAAEGVGAVLTRELPRTDFPDIGPAAATLAAERVPKGRPEDEETSALHRAMVGVAAAHAGVSVAEPATVGEARRMLQGLYPRMLSGR